MTKPSRAVFTGLLLASTSLVALACGGRIDDPVAGESAALGAGECVDAAAGGGWVNSGMPTQRGRFVVEMRAYPASADGRPIDAVVGLSSGPAHAFVDLASIVRFNDTGHIDMRRGAAYAADFAEPYCTGCGGYRFVLDIDVTTHTYSAWVKAPHGESLPTERIATRYPFRTEQRAVGSLDNVGVRVNSASGSLSACGVQAGACMPASAGTGWSSRSFARQVGKFRAELDIEALDAPIDGLIGLSNGSPSKLTSLAAAVRFNASGRIDVRNGGAYAADATLVYTAGQRYHVVFDVNRAAHRYTVTVVPPLGEPVRLATDYAFRTEQATVAALDTAGGFVDSPEGEQLACNVRATPLP